MRLAAAAHSHTCQEVRRRRRDVIFVLAVAALLSLFAALLTGSALVVFLQVLVDVALVTYIYLLLTRTAGGQSKTTSLGTRGRDGGFVKPTISTARLAGANYVRADIFGPRTGKSRATEISAATPVWPFREAIEQCWRWRRWSDRSQPNRYRPDESLRRRPERDRPPGQPPEAAQSRLADMQSARELALAASRRATRFASGAVRAVHTRDASRWELLFGQSEQSLREAQAALAGSRPSITPGSFKTPRKSTERRPSPACW